MRLIALDHCSTILDCRYHHFLVNPCQVALLKICSEVDAIVESLAHEELIEQICGIILAKEGLDWGP